MCNKTVSNLSRLWYTTHGINYPAASPLLSNQGLHSKLLEGKIKMEKLLNLKSKFIHMPLKRAYYLMFLVLVVTPIIGVLIVVLFLLNQQFKQQALENIKQSQQTVVTQLKSDVDNVSMRMSIIVHANDYELLRNAAMTDTDDMAQKARYRKKLSNIENLYLDPEKNILSFYFYMNDSSDIYLKGYIKKAGKA